MKLIIGLVMGFLICYTNGTCNFPSDWTGTWLHSLHGTITLNTTTMQLTEYPDGSVTLNCDTLANSKYLVLSSGPVYVQGNFLYLYACLEITQLKSSLYKIIHRTLKNSLMSGYRYISTPFWYYYLYIDAYSCTDYSADPDKEYYLMMKSDEIDNVKINAPSPFDETLVFTANENSCFGKSVLVSSCQDETRLDIDGNECSTIGFTDYEHLNVIYSTTSDDAHTIWTYNSYTQNDTYKFVCWIVNMSGTVVKATQNPQFCDATQSSTEAAANGKELTGTFNYCKTEEKNTTGVSSKYCRTCGSNNTIYCEHGCCNYDCCLSPLVIAVGTVSAGVILSAVIGGVIIYIVQNRYNRVPKTDK